MPFSFNQWKNSNMKKDISGRQDIENLVNAFYDKVRTDDTIGLYIR